MSDARGSEQRAQVIDYDRIAVLAAGRLVEFGPPAELLRAPDGQLAQLVEQTGPVMAAHLRAAANHAAAEARKQTTAGDTRFSSG